MKKNIPEFKKELIRYLKSVSDDKDFILSVGSYVGQNEENATKIIEFIKSENDISESDVLTLALKIYYN